MASGPGPAAASGPRPRPESPARAGALILSLVPRAGFKVTLSSHRVRLASISHARRSLTIIIGDRDCHGRRGRRPRPPPRQGAGNANLKTALKCHGRGVIGSSCSEQ